MPDQKAFSINDLLLAVLHAVSMDSVPESMLIQIGEYMGLSTDSIRGTLAKLIKRNYVQVNEDNAYSILPHRSLFSQHFEQWRLSEKRRISWDKSWVICELPEVSDDQARKRSLWALNLLGFKQTFKGMIRPNNLLGGIDALRMKLKIFGIEKSAELHTLNDLPEKVQHHLATEVWPIEELNQTYKDMYVKVETGYALIRGRVTQSVLVYALKVGYEAVTTLAIDPLLPESMQDPAPRIKLTRILKEYETLGKKYWEHVIPGIRFH